MSTSTFASADTNTNVYDVVIGGGPVGENVADRVTQRRAAGRDRRARSSSAANAPTGPACPRKRCCAAPQRSTRRAATEPGGEAV